MRINCNQFQPQKWGQVRHYVGCIEPLNNKDVMVASFRINVADITLRYS